MVTAIAHRVTQTVAVRQFLPVILCSLKLPIRRGKPVASLTVLMKQAPDWGLVTARGTGDGNADDVWNNDDKHLDFDTSRISLSGGGVGQTTFEVDTFKFTIPEKFWDIISAIRWLVIAMAYLIGLRIVFGG